MAARYDLSSPDHDSSAYAALPGTGPSDFVPHNITPMKSKIPGKMIAGCHPSRWIYELINNDFTVCDLFERARRAKLDNHFGWEHPHRLVINGNQSFTTPSARILSAICLDCHFHFIFKLAWEEAHSVYLCHHSQSGWPLRDNQFPWHHLVWVGSDSDSNIARDSSKYYPLLARENFVCSAPPCTFQVTLEVSEPRMPSWWLNLLLDHDAILQELRLARQEEPTRYEGATDDWAYQAPSNLNTYLKNLLESTPDGVRSISKRNKRFSVLFGPRCFSIFRELEFSETVEDHEGVDEGSFTPAAPAPPAGPFQSTEIGTYRAYLEDVRAEVQNLIHKSGNSSERPTFCIPVLQDYLQCKEVPNISASALVNVERYRLLGVLPTQSREIVVNAYKRQWELLPSRRKELVDGLMAIAHDSGDELLSEFAMTQSSVFESQPQTHGDSRRDAAVSDALGFLGLSPPNNYNAETLIHAFRNTLIRNPSDAGSARSMLYLIAEASTDDVFQATLVMEADRKMSLETAKTVLGLYSVDSLWQEMVDATKIKLDGSTSREEKELYLDALDSIAEHTSSPPLKQSVMELRHAQGIHVSGATHSTESDTKEVNLDLPVGLHNIGNTCYLNSLLQYLFTVKPIRDIVFNYDDLRLDLTDENIQARRLGGNKMQMDRGEAVVAQAFAQELAILFDNLRTSDQAATRPSQRLANAVLLSTHTLLTGPKQPSEAPAASKPPPLPARPSPALPASTSEDLDMINVSVQPVSDSLETASNSSTQTLVDHDDVQSDRSYEKIETVFDEIIREDPQPTSILSVYDGDDTLMDETRQVTDAATTRIEDTAVNAEQSGADVDMADAEEPETVDQKVLNALEHQKRSSGTDQQDVEEVMGSIINRLQAAIRPSSVDEETGIQLESIMKTFFVTTVNYTKKFDEKEYQHEISFDRSITAFPAEEGPCSLYDALGRNFDQQILEESKLSRYTAIKTLPPVLHILIQRSQSMGSKNGNPVVIPETLYLDRYMDAPHDSPVFRRRVEDWITAERIVDLKSQLAKVESVPSYISFLENYQDGNTLEPANQDSTSEECWDFDGLIEDGFLLVTPARSDNGLASETATKVEGIRQTHTALRDMMENELLQRQQTIEQNLGSQKEVAYRLHAVICHRGHLTSGHYWVWIHDFEAGVWRWYNDADVKENKDTAEVLQALSTSGEPYFLCYVRDQDKEEYVSVPGRHKPKTENETEPEPEKEKEKEKETQAEAEKKKKKEESTPAASPAATAAAATIIGADTDADGDVRVSDGATGHQPVEDEGIVAAEFDQSVVMSDATSAHEK